MTWIPHKPSTWPFRFATLNERTRLQEWVNYKRDQRGEPIFEYRWAPTMVLRMIEGACRNAAHAHPGQILDDRLARSIAKRAAGTLTSSWCAVLAMPKAWSEGKSVELANGPLAGTGRTLSSPGGSVANTATSRPGARHTVRRRASLQLLRAAIENAVGEAILRGEIERAEAFRDVLRCIAEMEGGAPAVIRRKSKL